MDDLKSHVHKLAKAPKASASKVEAVANAALIVGKSELGDVVTLLAKNLVNAPPERKLGFFYAIDAILKKEARKGRSKFADCFRVDKHFHKIFPSLSTMAEKDKHQITKAVTKWHDKEIYTKEQLNQWLSLASCPIPDELQLRDDSTNKRKATEEAGHGPAKTPRVENQGPTVPGINPEMLQKLLASAMGPGGPSLSPTNALQRTGQQGYHQHQPQGDAPLHPPVGSGPPPLSSGMPPLASTGIPPLLPPHGGIHSGPRPPMGSGPPPMLGRPPRPPLNGPPLESGPPPMGVNFGVRGHTSMPPRPSLSHGRHPPEGGHHRGDSSTNRFGGLSQHRNHPSPHHQGPPRGVHPRDRDHAGFNGGGLPPRGFVDHGRAPRPTRDGAPHQAHHGPGQTNQTPSDPRRQLGHQQQERSQGQNRPPRPPGQHQPRPPPGQHPPRPPQVQHPPRPPPGQHPPRPPQVQHPPRPPPGLPRPPPPPPKQPTPKPAQPSSSGWAKFAK